MFKAILLAGVFQNFWNLYLERYEPHRARFLTATELPWQGALKKYKNKIRSIK